MAYCRVSNGEGIAIWPAAGFRMEKGQHLLQGFEWRRDTDMVYCSASTGEETAPTAGFRMEKGQRYLLQGYEWRRDSNMACCRV